MVVGGLDSNFFLIWKYGWNIMATLYSYQEKPFYLSLYNFFNPFWNTLLDSLYLVIASHFPKLWGQLCIYNNFELAIKVKLQDCFHQLLLTLACYDTVYIFFGSISYACRYQKLKKINFRNVGKNNKYKGSFLEHLMAPAAKFIQSCFHTSYIHWGKDKEAKNGKHYYLPRQSLCLTVKKLLFRCLVKVI